MTEPICPYCSTPARLIDNAEIYGGRSFGRSWVCGKWPTCDAYVGCHPNTTRPLGRLADKALRKAKKQAHSAFDALWKRKIRTQFCNKRSARGAGYLWLAKQLEIESKDCHVGMFDLKTCQRVVKICEPYLGPA